MGLQMLFLTENMYPCLEGIFIINRNQRVAAWSHSPTCFLQITFVAAPFRTPITNFQGLRELQKYFLSWNVEICWGFFHIDKIIPHKFPTTHLQNCWTEKTQYSLSSKCRNQRIWSKSRQAIWDFYSRPQASWWDSWWVKLKLISC